MLSSSALTYCTSMGPLIKHLLLLFFYMGFAHIDKHYYIFLKASLKFALIRINREKWPATLYECDNDRNFHRVSERGE